MDLSQFLHDRMGANIASAEETLRRAHLRNYEKEGAEHVHQRLKALYVLTVRAVKERNLGPMVAHADTIARDRFNAGYDLWEVQTAFNVLEEVIWSNIMKELPPCRVCGGPWTCEHNPRHGEGHTCPTVCDPRKQIKSPVAEPAIAVHGNRRRVGRDIRLVMASCGGFYASHECSDSITKESSP